MSKEIKEGVKKLVDLSELIEKSMAKMVKYEKAMRPKPLKEQR